MSRWWSYSDGWDGEEAVQPDRQALANATIFLVLARAAALPAGQPFITADGEFGFRWARNDGFASTTFADDGHIVAFARAPGAQEALRLDSLFGETDLDPIFAGIRRLAYA